MVEDKSQPIAALTLTVMLGMTGIAFFVWVATTGMVDTVGLATSIIFLMLTGVQSVAVFYWWRRQRTYVFKVNDEDLHDMKLKSEYTTRDNALVLRVKDDGKLHERGEGDATAMAASKA